MISLPAATSPRVNPSNAVSSIRRCLSKALRERKSAAYRWSNGRYCGKVCTNNKSMQSTYIIHSVDAAPSLDANDPAWRLANVAEIAHFRQESSDHHPKTLARLLHDKTGFYGLFQVDDKYVRAVRSQFQGEVWKDSCVEFFVQPKKECGYFNFEMNCGGALLCSYVTDPTRTPTGLKKALPLPENIGGLVKTRSTLSKVVDPEITKSWSPQKQH